MEAISKSPRKWGLFVAVMALLVNSPRFILIFLRVDGLALPKNIEGLMLVITGIATGVVLSGGGAFIAHALSNAQGRSDRLVRMLYAAWLLMLAFSVVLISPLLVAGIRATDLVDVMPAPWMQWLWSIVAVLAVEVLAGAAMAADSVLANESGHARSYEQARPRERVIARPQAPIANAPIRFQPRAIEQEQEARLPWEQNSSKQDSSEQSEAVEQKREAIEEQEQESYACPDCDFVAGSRQALGAHSRKHKNAITLNGNGHLNGAH